MHNIFVPIYLTNKNKQKHFCSELICDSILSTRHESWIAQVQQFIQLLNKQDMLNY